MQFYLPAFFAKARSLLIGGGRRASPTLQHCMTEVDSKTLLMPERIARLFLQLPGIHVSNIPPLHDARVSSLVSSAHSELA